MTTVLNAYCVIHHAENSVQIDNNSFLACFHMENCTNMWIYSDVSTWLLEPLITNCHDIWELSSPHTIENILLNGPFHIEEEAGLILKKSSVISRIIYNIQYI